MRNAKKSCSRSVHVSDCVAIKKNIVHLVAYIHMLTSINEKIFKTEKTYL